MRRAPASGRDDPPHVGLGSGTKLALAVAQALAALNGRAVDAPGLAEAAGRAAAPRGDVDVRLGGLVVEGGVRGGEDRPAPLLGVTRCRTSGGSSSSCRTPSRGSRGPPRSRPSAGSCRRRATAAIAQLVLTSLLPALVDHDLAEFGAALTRVQQLVGDAFAPVQGGRFHREPARSSRR